MIKILILVGVLVALGVLKRLAPQLVGRWLGGVLGRAIGDHALAQQPDAIHLEPTSSAPWKDAAAMRMLTEPLRSRGFEDAGAFRVREMPGVSVQLMTHPGECMTAAIYEHPQAGTWFDIVTRYQNGKAVTFTTAKPTGLDPRPGFATIRAPGFGSAALFARSRSERPAGEMKPALADQARGEFEQAYADEMAWRKHRGISGREVAETLKERQAA
jgi:hypothetical protein